MKHPHGEQGAPVVATLEAYRHALSALVDGSSIDCPEAIVEHTGMPLEDAEVVWSIARHACSTSAAADEQAARALATALADDPQEAP